MTTKTTYRDHEIKIEVHHDEHMGEPWKEHDGHGIVSEWVRRDKKPGELVLNESRGSFRYYDFAETLKIARRDGWGFLPGELETGRDNPDSMAGWAKCGPYYAHHAENFNRAIESVYAQHRASMTAKQYVAEAVRRDYEHLRAWCNDEWHWQGYTTKITKPDGETIDGDSCWGFDGEEYMLSEAMDCARATVDDLILTAEQTQIAECCP